MGAYAVSAKAGLLMNASGEMQADARRPRAKGGIYGVTVFLSSVLLFLVQPIIARFVLPWFGGAPAVWTTCLLFFQVVLLLGYLYAHLLTKMLGRVEQACVHVPLLAGSLLLLPIIPAARLAPLGGNAPVMQILQLLGVSVGLPYFVLSASTPLLQAWYVRKHPGAGAGSAYRLYALSNAGSLLALVSYPFALEPWLSRRVMAQAFGGGLAVFTVCCAICAIRAARITWDELRDKGRDVEPLGRLTLPPSKGRRMLWMLLAGCASLLLMATTNKISQDVAVVPFLWIAPLGIYLLSFVLCFGKWPWYQRALFFPLLVGAAVAVCMALLRPDDFPAVKQIGIYCGALFVFCMVCHGELARMRPVTRHATTFYLWVAAGGACGGAIVAIAAPLVFRGMYELHVGVLLCCASVMLALYSEEGSWLRGGWGALAWLILIPAFLFLGFCLYVSVDVQQRFAVTSIRNFYGALTIHDVNADVASQRQIVLRHGGVVHGLQFMEESKSQTPTTYYTRFSGIGLAMEHSFPTDFPRRVGIVGLGAGTLAAYAKPSDTFHFYEINPAVIDVALTPFTFFSNATSIKKIISGDARLSLESEDRQHYDLLVLDAFSGDAIPIHLLTVEAFQVYREQLEADGLIAVHITNRHLDLRPVVARMAAELKMDCVWIPDLVADETTGRFPSEWMLLSKDATRLAAPEIRKASRALPKDAEKFPLWTDDYASLAKVLK
jgi:spermidine synthase